MFESTKCLVCGCPRSTCITSHMSEGKLHGIMECDECGERVEGIVDADAKNDELNNVS